MSEATVLSSEAFDWMGAYSSLGPEAAELARQAQHGLWVTRAAMGLRCCVPGKGRKARTACAAGGQSQPPRTSDKEETGSERVDDLPRCPLTLVHKLPPAPGPLGELLRVRLLDARPLVQAVHEVAAQAVSVIDPLDSPLVVPDLGDRATL